MQLVKSLSVLALAAGAVVAIPAHADKGLVARGWKGGNRFWQRPRPGVSVVGYYGPTETVTTTVATTTTTIEIAPETPYVEPTPAPAAEFFQPPSQPQPQSEQPPAQPESLPAAPYTPPAPAPAPSPEPEPETSAPAPSTGGSSTGGYMGIVSKWRSALGLSQLTQDSKLEANALKTSQNSVGGLKHELNPGTFGQVLAPGTPDNFESVFVGGWLCERPSLPGLNGICSTLAKGWDHAGQTGHADILTSGSYSKIGCAIASSTGVWSCDLA